MLKRLAALIFVLALSTSAYAQFPGAVTALGSLASNPGSRPLPAYTIASSAASPQASGEFVQTATNPATLNLTAGDTLFIYVNDCGSGTCGNPGDANGPQPSSITDSAGAIGACTLLVGNWVSYYNSLIGEICPITQSAVNDNITANFPAGVYWSQIIAVDVKRSPAAMLVDEGIGTGQNFLGIQYESVGPMTPTTSPNFVIAALDGGSEGVDVIPGNGFTTIQNPVEPNGSTAFLVEYMITYNTNPVTATGSFTATQDARMVAAILN